MSDTSAGAPSVINGGGAVGAADLLQAPHEVIELDLAMPMPQLAQQVHRLAGSCTVPSVCSKLTGFMRGKAGASTPKLKQSPDLLLMCHLHRVPNVAQMTLRRWQLQLASAV